MMMKALGAGGMPVAYEPKRDELNHQFGDDEYQPNEGGFFELARETYQDRKFPLPFRGWLIKGLVGCLQRLPVANYKIVLMLRSPEEIRQSYEAFFGNKCPKIGGLDFNDDNYNAAMINHVGQLDNRKDVQLQCFHYRQVIRDPIGVFKCMTDSGWPIDPQKASEIVDPNRCRFKKEELEIGI